MSKQQQQKRPSPTVPTQQTAQAAAKKPAAARPEKGAAPKFNWGSSELIYGRENFIWMGIGLGLIALGLILMSGGAQPDPSKWDASIIYSPRRITLAPMLMLAGFIVQIYAIFKRKKVASTEFPDA